MFLVGIASVEITSRYNNYNNNANVDTLNKTCFVLYKLHCAKNSFQKKFNENMNFYFVRLVKSEIRCTDNKILNT